MKHASTLLIAGLSITAWPRLASSQDLDKLPPPAARQDLTYAKDIRPLLEASCFECHGERRQRAGLRLDSREALLQGSDEGKVVIPGNSRESLLVVAVAQIDDETAMPPRRGRAPFGGGFGGAGGTRQRGRPGEPAGPGARRGNDPLRSIVAQVFAQADADKDGKLTRAEFGGVVDAWFGKLDAESTGKLSREQLEDGLDAVLPASPVPAIGPGRGAGGQRGGDEEWGLGPARFLAPGLVTAADGDRDGSVTRAELKGTFEGWFTKWDEEKSDALTEGKFLDGWSAALPRPDFGGPGGARGPGGRFGGPERQAGRGPGGGRGGPGDRGAPGEPEVRDRPGDPGRPGVAGEPGAPRGPGGFQGFGGFGRRMLAQQILAQADEDNDRRLSKAEFQRLAGTWFEKLDREKAGRLRDSEFLERLDPLLLPVATDEPGPDPRPADPGRRGGRGGPGARGNFGPAASIGPALFTAGDADKDGWLTGAELTATFEKWFTEWDGEKTGALDEDGLYRGLSAALPRGGAGGPGPGGPGGGFGGFGGFGRDPGQAQKPLSAEQVGLVRAWIDQGAK